MVFRAGREIEMDQARKMMRRLADFYRELDRGIAVMRGEEPIPGHLPGHLPGVDWSEAKARGSAKWSASDRPCRRRCSAR